jgi:hypothetical protein
MSKHTLARELNKEIERLNREIDLRILKGLSYKRESLRHRFLLKQLQSISVESPFTSGFFGKLASRFAR